MPSHHEPVRRRLLAAAALGALLTAVVGGVAAAHNVLRSTSPAAGARVDAVPARVVLTFDKPALALGTRVIVTGPDGPVSAGRPVLRNATVTQRIRPGAPAGSYTVAWRVTSVDGHPITGTFRFAAARAGGSPPAPTATPSATDPSATPDGTGAPPPASAPTTSSDVTATTATGAASPAGTPTGDPGSVSPWLLIAAFLATVAAAAGAAVLVAPRRRGRRQPG